MAEERQIHAMIDFIECDAQEKAREYADEAQQLYDSEKASLVEAQKKKVLAATDDKKKQMEIERRVARAQVSKEQRMRVMDERGLVLKQLKDEVKTKVKAIVNNATQYKQLLADLLRQSAISLRSDSVVKCRKADEQLVASLLKQTQDSVEQATGEVFEMSIATDAFLDDAESWGGVVLVSTDGRITCDNTLACRMEHTFAEQVPTVRHYLFHEKAKLDA